MLHLYVPYMFMHAHFIFTLQINVLGWWGREGREADIKGDFHIIIFLGVSSGTVQGLGSRAPSWYSFPHADIGRSEAEKWATFLWFLAREFEFAFYLYAVGLGRWEYPSGFQMLGTGANHKESQEDISPTAVIFSWGWGHCLLIGSGPNSHWFLESGEPPTIPAQTSSQAF